MNRKQLIIILISLMHLIVKISFAQDDYRLPAPPSQQSQEPKTTFKDKLFYGGNFGLQFGALTFIDVSPLIGYRINKKISVGAGITYQYFRRRDVNYNFETNIYGARVFGRYFITENLFTQGELEYLNLEAFDALYRRRVDVMNVFGGIGYFQRFSSNSGVTAMLLYNFNQTYYSPYSNPVFRIGVNLGF